MGLLFGFFIDPRVIMNRIAIKVGSFRDLMGSVQTWIQRRPNIVGTDAQDQLVLHPTESSPDMNAPQHPRLVVSKTPAASQWTDIVPLLWKLDNTPSEYKSATSNFRRLVMQWTGVHVSAVHDIRFSADGDYLATCSQDQKVVVWAMRPEVRIHFSSLCDPSTQPHRLSWHPKHLLLAVMLVRSANLVIYDLSGAGKPTVSSWSAKQRPVKAKQGPVRAVTWMPSKEALVYTEGHHVRCFNRDSEEWNIELPYSLDEVAVTPDGTKLVVVGTVDSVDVDGKQFKPSKSPPERRIIMIEIDGRAKIFETPTLNQVRGLDVSSSGALLLVTYEGKASPQLFRIHSTWLVLLQTYRPPKGEVEYSGYSQLGIRGWTSGVDGLRIDECAVMCADKEGSIFIWDRGSSDLLHTLKAPLSRASHLTGFAWNHGPIENPTIAASSANGTIWFYHPYGSGAGD
ncbi:uncharacterized protein EI90DRAFT_3054144 [Cantharellus anzutake]|uniref:uncharacterized protein n=1 Tax=Cantharellus anzutake TaxID=1750568 RepID=UPI001904A7C8|nr:uncharacterized protein EI90DRAFT_3054144 [Cantharellus anzutake]KAF8332723.1 hypothetical protein EI90DRAFT_3054144 [Cantharellus anzutake]